MGKQTVLKQNVFAYSKTSDEYQPVFLCTLVICQCISALRYFIVVENILLLCFSDPEPQEDANVDAQLVHVTLR